MPPPRCRSVPERPPPGPRRPGQRTVVRPPCGASSRSRRPVGPSWYSGIARRGDGFRAPAA
eukprot:9070628-Lingulodinium_polyedra.AAC.1